jgi:hypothetical protein
MEDQHHQELWVCIENLISQQLDEEDNGG